MAKQTPYNHAKDEIKAGRFPNMPIEHIAGSFYLCDGQWNLLGGTAYTSKAHALTERSKILDRATKAAGRELAEH